MTDFRESAMRSTDFGEIQSLFQENFLNACRDQSLPSFRATCVDLLQARPAPLCLPYAFAYEARSLLHDWQLWEPCAQAIPYRPKPDLLAALDACLARPEAVDCRDNYYWPIIAGLRAYIVGDLDASFRHLAQAARMADFYRVVKDDLGGGAAFARSYPTPAALDQARTAKLFDRDVTFAAEFATPPRLVLSVSFDVVYARAFAQGWIDSVVPLAAHGVALHCHVMFRGAADLDLLQTLRDAAGIAGVDLALSIDTDIRHAQAYFASARFLKAETLLHRFRAPMVLADADSYIPDPAAFVATHLPRLLTETRVMGLLADGPWNGYLPWRRFSATWLFVPHRADAADFLGRTGDAITYFWDPRGCNWWIDQMALEVSRRCMVERSPEPLVFGDIFAELPGLLESSESFKQGRISALPEMRRLIEQGLPYWQALEECGRG
jgi:hypothetical protein